MRPGGATVAAIVEDDGAELPPTTTRTEDVNEDGDADDIDELLLALLFPPPFFLPPPPGPPPPFFPPLGMMETTCSFSATKSGGKERIQGSKPSFFLCVVEASLDAPPPGERRDRARARRVNEARKEGRRAFLPKRAKRGGKGDNCSDSKKKKSYSDSNGKIQRSIPRDCAISLLQLYVALRRRWTVERNARTHFKRNSVEVDDVVGGGSRRGRKGEKTPTSASTFALNSSCLHAQSVTFDRVSRESEARPE